MFFNKVVLFNDSPYTYVFDAIEFSDVSDDEQHKISV
jgi:hypothetical protein